MMMMMMMMMMMIMMMTTTATSIQKRSAISDVTVARAVGNLFSRYLGAGEVTPGVLGDTHRGEVTSDITTGFVALCAIYFPSVTGAPIT